MKKKKRKERKRSQPARHEPRVRHAKLRKTAEKRKIESVQSPWLRLVPGALQVSEYLLKNPGWKSS